MDVASDRHKLVEGLRSDGRISEEEYSMLVGVRLSWPALLGYAGGALVLLGVLGLGATVWAVLHGAVPRLLLGAAVSAGLFWFSLRLRHMRAGFGAVAYLGSLGVWIPVTQNLVQALWLNGQADWRLALAQAVFTAIAGVYLYLWRIPVVTAAILLSSFGLLQFTVGAIGPNAPGVSPNAISGFIYGIILITASLFVEKLQRRRESPSDHGAWFALFGWGFMTMGYIAAFTVDGTAGVLFAALQAATAWLALREARGLVGIVASLSLAAYLEWLLYQALPQGTLVDALISIAIGVAILSMAVRAHRRYTSQTARPVRGSPWI